MAYMAHRGHPENAEHKATTSESFDLTDVHRITQEFFGRSRDRI